MPVTGNNVFNLINAFSGGALLQLTVFALGIMPYITASIILQLLTVVIPRLETLKKEGQSGQAEDHPVHPLRHPRLAVLQATGIVRLARNNRLIPSATSRCSTTPTASSPRPPRGHR
jgi:preprotein translocase subunit SecY